MWSLYALLPDYIRGREALLKLIPVLEGQFPTAHVLEWLEGIVRSVAAGERTDISEATLEHLRERASWERKLADWADGWCLSDEWILDRVNGTLWYWAHQPGREDEFERTYGSHSMTLRHLPDREEIDAPDWAPMLPSIGRDLVFRNEEIRFTFQHPGWHPELNYWSYVEPRIRAAFEHQLRAYHAHLCHLARERGLVEAPTKRGGEDVFPDQHFEWLARWQVQRWTKPQIAEEYDVGEWKTEWTLNGYRRKHSGISAITDALKRTSALIGLTLRKGKQGRHRK